ncbi:hypothetical protein CK203_082750 [Vitis vinifera]|uniref:Uncharacterized protein n=1 Tax=Vitis vinifera TaxID=29760 RepID=A0A438F9Z8_VITVI|nr:hypothetical protein CK203_082750 [Vitis vinifera]
MKAFASQRKNSEDQLRLRLEEAEASLSTAREDNEALRADLAEAKSREESTVVRLYEAEDEMARLRGSCIFKNFSKYQRTIFEASGSYFAIVMSGCSLLIVCHPNGCAFSYSSAQSKFLPNSMLASPCFVASVRIVGNPISVGMTASIPYARVKECFLLAVRVWFDRLTGRRLRTKIPECNAVKLRTIVSYDGLWNSKTADDVFPYELGDIFVFDASICFNFHPFTEAPKVGSREVSLVQVPPIMVKRAACTWTLCACLGSPSKVPVRRYSVMLFVHSWPSAWLASMVLQVEVSATEGLVCTCTGNRIASLMGGEAAMRPRRRRAHFRARSNPDKMASYSASLLEAGNPSRMACSRCSPVGDCSRSPTPDPDDREAHQLAKSTILFHLIPGVG